ncbi:MAG: HD domain-containing protein [Lachnospiraceae bacterium]|nr:HD domain-containing protein [Lachnospiraceae bacterium]
MIYYFAALLLSIIFTTIYVTRYKKYFDARVTVIFTLIPVAQLGYVMMARATTLSEALIANRITYMGGIYLQLFITFYIIYICGIRLKRWISFLLFALNTAFYLFVICNDMSKFYYKSADITSNGDVTYLIKDYGLGHTIFYGIIIVYLIIGLTLILVNYRNKSVPRVLLNYVLIMETVTVVLYFATRLLKSTYETAPLQYVIFQFILIIMSDRTGLYQIEDSVLESVIKKGAMGFFSFDMHRRFLGANDEAKVFFPELIGISVDKKPSECVDVSGEFFNTLDKWMGETDYNAHKEFLYEKDDHIYKITQTVIRFGTRPKGYQFFVLDDTKEQKYIKLINGYNEELEKEVELKTKHIQEIQDKMVLGMADMVESRDVSTGGHIKRTSHVIRLLVNEMEKDASLIVPEGFYERVVKAASMHDLGKIAIDDAILRKPERFSEEEFEIMKKHSMMGAGIVRQVLSGIDDREFVKIAENMAHFHHEKFDGTGYPEGISGDTIPFEARIMAVADTYDALVSKRCYKEKMPFSEVYRIIEENMGTQFDPSLNKYFLAARSNIEEFYKDVE